MMASSHSQCAAYRSNFLLVGACVLFACSMVSSTSLANTGLFPAKNKRMNTPINREALPPLEPVVSESVAKPVDLSAQPSNGPLRIVIPNIQNKEAPAVAAQPAAPAKVAEQPKPAPAKPKRVAAKPKPAQVIAAAPKAPTPIDQAANLGDLQPSAGGRASADDAMIEYALQLLNDGFSNAVILDFLAGKTSPQTISSIPAPLPVAWIIPVCAPSHQFTTMSSLESLAPAAGDPTPLIAPAIPTPSTNSTTENESTPNAEPTANAEPIIQAASADPITPPTPIIPNAAAAPTPEPSTPTTSAAVAAPAEEKLPAQQPTEPEPTLSSASKKVLDKLPPVEAKRTPPKTKVDIDRATEKGDFGGNVSVNSHEAMGIKMDVKRPKIDMNYQLEKAYNAVVAGKNEEAILIYQDVLTNDSKNKDALFGLATTYHRVGQLDLARSLYGKLLEVAPNYRDGLNNFLVLLAEEAPNEALVKMEELAAKNPGFSPIPAQMAIIYQKMGNTDKAVDKMYNALALAPENITYRYNLAVLLDKQRNYEQASKLYQQVLDSAAKGTVIPWDTNKIQQRLTFIRSNGSR